MGAFDAIIQLLLYVAFGVYVVMGLALLGLGGWYINDVGAVGATATWLLLFGFAMLVIGGLAIFANLKKIWLLLFIIELINVALFLGLYIAITVVLLMASGSSDPIRRASLEAWVDVKPTLTVPGSASDATSDGGLSDRSYCEVDVVVSNACQKFYTEGPKQTGCNIDNRKATTQGGGTTWVNAINNCTSLGDWEQCKTLQPLCDACEDACREQSIQDIKDQIVPVSFFVLVVVGYFFVVIVWNNIIIGDEIEGLGAIIGLVLNGALLLLSIILIGLGVYGYTSMECPKTRPDCEPTSLIYVIILGGCIFAVSGTATAGIKLSNSVLLRLATIVMVFVGVFLLLAAIILGMSSGAVMDDMNHYYDTQYPKLRQALERVDNSYCQMTKVECTALTLESTSVYPKDKAKVKVEGSTIITKADVWKAQFNEAALESSMDARPNWLSVCETTGICIYCEEFETATESFKIVNRHKNVSLAANINFQAAVNGLVCQNSAGSIKEVESYTQFAQGKHYGGALASEYRGQPGTCGTGYAAVPRNYSYVAKDDKCLKNYDATKDQSGAKASKMVASAWQSIISNHSRFKTNPGDGSANNAFKYVGKCALAVLNHVAKEAFCPDGADENSKNMKVIKLAPQSDALVKDSYLADCESCQETAGSSGFSFIAGGATTAGSPDSKCLNYFVGHMKKECSQNSGGGATCKDRFNKAKDAGAIKAVDNIKYMVDKAYATGSTSKFCSYPDLQCKEKIQDQIESSLKTIGIFGVVFCLFFMVVIFFTLQAIHSYRAGEDDDDGEEEAE